MSEETPEKPEEAVAEASAKTPDVRRRSAWQWLTSLLRKPTAWVVGIVVVALAGTFGSGLQSLFSGLLPDGWSDPGSGIEVVDVLRRPTSGPVLIPNAEAAAGFTDFGDARAAVNDPEWQAQNEAYAMGSVTWEVTVVGRHSEDVVITDLRPERTGPCTQKLQEGVVVDDVPAGEGSKTELKTAIDAKVPALTSADDGSAYFDDGTVTLSKGETVVISIEATSAGPTCQWVLAADYVDHGKRKEMTIKAPGDHPFAITGMSEGHPQDTWTSSCSEHALKPEDWSKNGQPKCK